MPSAEMLLHHHPQAPEKLDADPALYLDPVLGQSVPHWSETGKPGFDALLQW